MVTIENFNKCFYDSNNENFYNKEAFENSSPEPNDIYNIAPSFSELELKEFDKMDNIICQNVQELQEECCNMPHDDLDLIGISLSRLDRIKAHIKNYGMVKPIHSNTGHSSIRPDYAIVNDQVKQELNYYIHNYASFYEFPSPVRHI
ncbi:16620_t:CDS:2 [Cetraspora pellucida]|uniref:16620_t:CDS:1 n=1 Tax=Cetraspora pellucida TaxID=1433469 RepID=A0A9N9AMH8_9GLOM|nr:16620_t:CDS:2 [Cetraspora pellucida]